MKTPTEVEAEPAKTESVAAQASPTVAGERETRSGATMRWPRRNGVPTPSRSLRRLRLALLIGALAIVGYGPASGAPEPAPPDFQDDISSSDVGVLMVDGQKTLTARAVPGTVFSFYVARGNPEPGHTRVTVSADAAVWTHGIGEVAPCGHRHEAPAAEAQIELASNGIVVARSAVASEPRWKHLTATYTTRGVNEVMQIRLRLGYAAREENDVALCRRTVRSAHRGDVRASSDDATSHRDRARKVRSTVGSRRVAQATRWALRVEQ